MAGTLDTGDEGVISGINVTPLVDVVLVLLIIFIVTASFMLKSSIPMELPKAQSAEEAGAALMVVGIASDGQLYINGREATVDDIPAAAAEYKQRTAALGQKANVFVSADVAAQYGQFAEIVDRLRIAGITDISMDTKPVDGAAQAEPAKAPAASSPAAGSASSATLPGGIQEASR